MINNIQQLKSEILTRKIASEEDLRGWSERDIELIEQKYGKLPLAYKQIMNLLGCEGGKWLSHYKTSIFSFERAIDINDWLVNGGFLLNDSRTETIKELENVFFMGGQYAEYNGGIQFIKTGENLLDSPVYCIDMASTNLPTIDEWLDTLEIDSNSIWEWIEKFVDLAEHEMLKPKPEPKRFWSLW